MRKKEKSLPTSQKIHTHTHKREGERGLLLNAAVFIFLKDSFFFLSCLLDCFIEWYLGESSKIRGKKKKEHLQVL